MPNYYMPSPAEYQMSPTSFAYLSPQEKYQLMYTPQEKAGWGAPVSWGEYDQQRAAAGFLPRTQLGQTIQPTSQFYPSVRTNFGLDAPPAATPATPATPGVAPATPATPPVGVPGQGGVPGPPLSAPSPWQAGGQSYNPAGYGSPTPYSPGREEVPATLRAYPTSGTSTSTLASGGASGAMRGTGAYAAPFSGTTNMQTPGKAPSTANNWYSPLQGSTQQRSDRYWK